VKKIANIRAKNAEMDILTYLEEKVYKHSTLTDFPMADNKIRMPSSGAGLTSFYEESKSKVLISPQAVLGIIVLIIVITIILNSM